MRYYANVHGPMRLARVLVDGAPVSSVYFADEELGIVRCVALDENGNKQLIETDDEYDVRKVEYKGTVEIKCSPEEREWVERIPVELEDVPNATA